MEELKHGSEEMSQYIVTLKNGKQVRLFVGAEDWKTEARFILGIENVEGITRYSTETVTVE